MIGISKVGVNFLVSKIEDLTAKAEEIKVKP